MWRGRGSGVVLAAAIGVLALTPAPASAVGVKVGPQAHARGADSATPGAAVAPRRLLPVRGPAQDRATAPNGGALVRPAALPRPTGVGPSVLMSGSPAAGFSEPVVAVDPNNGNGRQLAAGSNDLTPAFRSHVIYTSGDGGATWQQFQGVSSQDDFVDPGVAFSTGTTTDFQIRYDSILDIGTSGATSVVVDALNSSGFPRPSVVVQSTDLPDRPMIATDPRSGNGGVYVAFDTNPSAPGAGQPIVVAASHDAGATYHAAQVWNSGGDIGAWPAVGADGTVYVVWDDYCGAAPTTLTTCPKPAGQILLSRSSDGGATWSSAPIHIADTTMGFGSILPNYAPECRAGCAQRPVGPAPQIAVDRSGGARNGTLYVVYGDGGDPQLGASTVPSARRQHVFLRESKDGGATWSGRIQLDTGDPNDSWEPSVAVDQSNGNVVVSWYDRRDDSSNRLYRTYFTESLRDDAVTHLPAFTAQIPLSDFQSDPTFDCLGTVDYQQIAAGSGSAHAVWTGMFTGAGASFSAAVDENAAATATPTGGGMSSQRRDPNGTLWLQLPAAASDIGVGANCQAWIISRAAVTGGGETWAWVGILFQGGGWVAIDGGGVRISVQAQGLPRVVNDSGRIFRLQANGMWEQLPGGGADIGSGADFSLWLIGLDGEPGGHGVWAFNGSGWNFANGGGERIAVGPDGLPWIVNNAGQIWHLTPGGWVEVPGGARDIGVGADGTVWIIGLNPIAGGWQTYRYNGTGWDAVNGGGVAISVGPDGLPWIVNSAGQIYERA